MCLGIAPLVHLILVHLAAAFFLCAVSIAPQHGGKKFSKSQKVLKATPKARAQNIRMGAAPYQATKAADKPPWACRGCYSLAVEEQWVHRYRFIPGDQVECRCGEHKGSCFLGTMEDAAEKYESRQEYLRTGVPGQVGNKSANGAGGRNGKQGVPSNQKPRTALERQQAEELRKLRNSAGDASNSNGANSCEDIASATAAEAEDPRWAELDERIAYFTTVASSAKRDLGKINGRFKDLLKHNLEDAERQVAEAKEQKATLRQATLDPQVALAE